MDSKRPAIILGLSYGALQVARSLGRRGIDVYGIGGTDGIVSSSRYIKKMAAPEREDDLLRYLVNFARKLGVMPVIFPMSDRYVLFVSSHWDVLSHNYLCPLPTNTTIERLVSKAHLAECFRAMGMKYPRTIVIEASSYSPTMLDDVRLPCILKPELQRYWEANPVAKEFIGERKAVLFIQTAEKLLKAVEALRTTGTLVVQEFIPGPSRNLYYYFGYRGHGGRMLASFVGNKRRTLPDTLGSETLLASVRQPELLELGNDLLHRLDYRGPAGIDFKYDSQDGAFKVIEMNCRLGINDGYLSGFGVDVPYIYYLDAQKFDVAEQCDYPIDITWYDFQGDLDWMRLYRKREGLSWLSWIMGLVRGYDSYASFCWHDPAPFLRSTMQLARRPWRRIAKALRRRAAYSPGFSPVASKDH